MSDYLPEEILVNILQRVTVKSTGRCACVCKAWNSIIKDRDFMFCHFSRNINVNDSLFIHFCSPRNENPLTFKDFYTLYLDNGQFDLLSTLKYPFLDQHVKESLSVVGTCNGLVCLADDNMCRFIIWNPSVRRYVTLPKATLETQGSCQVCIGFGFDSRNQDFKVVRIVNDFSKQDTQVEIYSLAIGYWINRTARAPPFFLLKSARAQSFMNGKLHWLVRSLVHNFILSFDLVEETFGELMFPQPMKKSAFLSILDGRGSLTVFDPQIEFKIWAMKEYGDVESWAVLFRCDLRRDRGLGFPLALTGSGKVVLERNDGAIVLLDPMRNLLKDLGVRGAYYPFARHYVESLFLLNQEYEVMSY